MNKWFRLDLNPNRLTLNPEPLNGYAYCIRYTKNKCQELFSRCDHLEDTMAEEAIALDAVYYGGYSLMASVN